VGDCRGLFGAGACCRSRLSDPAPLGATEVVIEQFWSPVFATSSRPDLPFEAGGLQADTGIYQRYTRTHPNTFQTEVERTNQPLPLNPDENIPWGEMYIASIMEWPSDAYAAVSLSAQLARSQLAQVAIGTNYSFEICATLRRGGGRFNNKWTMQLTSNLHFAFVEEHERFMIREEAGQHRTWETAKVPRRDDRRFCPCQPIAGLEDGQFTILWQASAARAPGGRRICLKSRIS